jgi:hypothetical protein
MLLAEKVAFILLIAALVVQWVARPSLSSALRRLWALGVVGISGILGTSAYVTYEGWQGSGLGKFFLPPHQSFAHFLSYIGERFLAPWVLALLAGIVAAWCAARMNRAYGERFFEPEEPSLIGLCFFMSGYPTFIFYLPALLLVGAGISALYQLCGRGRAPLYYWWVPVALSVILVKTYLLPESVLSFFVL